MRIAGVKMKRWMAAMLVMLCGAGCAERKPVSAEPGFSALVVEVAAVPKKGMKAAKTGGPVAGGYGEVEAGDESGANFERVNYEKLEGVVVWALPREGQMFQPLTDAGIKKSERVSNEVEMIFDGKNRRNSPMFAVGVGGRVLIHNDTSRPAKIYSVTDGNEFKLEIAARGVGEWKPVSSGPVEVWAAGLADPVAVVFVAESPWVKIARGGDAVTFTRMPPGKYEVGSWHSRLPGSHSTVSLTQGQVTVNHITISVDALER